MNSTHVSYGEEVARCIESTYSLDDQIALIRQRDTKPEEFQKFFNECERIKTAIKEYREAHPEIYNDDEDPAE